eukprot:208427_1
MDGFVAMITSLYKKCSEYTPKLTSSFGLAYIFIIGVVGMVVYASATYTDPIYAHFNNNILLTSKNVSHAPDTSMYINNDIDIDIDPQLRQYETETLNNIFIKYETAKKEPNIKCNSLIKTLQKMMKQNNSYYNTENCLNLPYSLDPIINNVSLYDTTVKRHDISYDDFLHHYQKRNETEFMFKLFFNVMYEYNIKIHLTGSSALAYHRNCNPILLYDHDFDFAIFYDHLNMTLLKQALKDEKLKKYGFSLALRRQRLVNDHSVAMQLFIRSKLFKKRFLRLTYIDIFVIHRTSLMYFASVYHGKQCWYLEPYKLHKINIILKYTKQNMDIYVPQPNEPNVLLLYGDNYMYMPWEHNENKGDPVMRGETSVIGIRAPITFYNNDYNTFYNSTLNINGTFFLDIPRIEHYCYY